MTSVNRAGHLEEYKFGGSMGDLRSGGARPSTNLSRETSQSMDGLKALSLTAYTNKDPQGRT